MERSGKAICSCPMPPKRRRRRRRRRSSLPGSSLLVGDAVM
jgi:hypothetical protein